jgi:RHS repeat-associated protein
MPTTNYIWDPLNDSYLMETDESGATTAVYTQEPSMYGGLISQQRGVDASYYHQDHLGSTRLLSNHTGTVTDSFTYDACGNQITYSGTTVTPFHWIGLSGYYWDIELTTYYIRARSYDPRSGQWRSQDPLAVRPRNGLYRFIFAARPPMHASRTHKNRFVRQSNTSATSSTERYGYSKNNPLVMYDPSGLIAIDCLCAGGSNDMGATFPQSIVSTECAGDGIQCCNSVCLWGTVNWEISTRLGPGTGKTNKTSLGFYALCRCGTPKRDRLISFPAITVGIAKTINQGPGTVKTLPPPVKGSTVTSGGALPCAIAIISCPNFVTTYHFSPGADTGGDISGYFWPSGCRAIVCGGDNTGESNCLADAVINSIKESGNIKLEGVSAASGCGIDSNGNWIVNNDENF